LLGSIWFAAGSERLEWVSRDCCEVIEDIARAKEDYKEHT